MDLILSYDDESESSFENGEAAEKESSPSDNKDQSCLMQLKPTAFQNTQICNDQREQSDHFVSDKSNFKTLNPQNPGTDFFNLSGKPREPIFTDKNAVCSENNVHKKIEVPDGEFWSEFVPTDLPASEQAPATSHEEYYRMQNMSYDDSNDNHSVESLHQAPKDHTSAQGQCRAHVVRNARHPYPRYYGSKHTKADRSTMNDSSKSTLLQHPSEKRKIFYIHSKVAPYLHTICGSKPALKDSASWLAHNGAANRLNWNLPNFSHLLVSAGMDSRICGWNVWSNIDPNVFTFTCHTKAIKHVDWCHSGKSVFSCSFDRTAQITDVETGKTKARLDHIGFVTAGSLLSTNTHLVVTGTDNMVLMWDTRTPQAPVKHYTYKEDFGHVQDLTFISGEREMVSCADLVTRDSADRCIMVWDVRSTAVLSNQVFQERYTCTRLKPHQDKLHFLAQTHGGYIALFSTESPYRMEKSKRFGGHKLLGYHIGFDVSSDGKLVYSGSAEGGVHVYDYRTGKLIRKLAASHGDDVIMDVACHPVLPSVLATCTWGGSIRLWQ